MNFNTCSIKSWATALVVAACTSMTANAQSLYGDNSAVVKLTTSNWDKQVIKSNKLWMVEFYAPWCGHCKQLTPHWEKAAEQLKGFVSVGAVDMTTDESVGRPFDVKGFPTLKFFGFDKKSPIAYEGARDTDAIRKFSLKNLNREVSARARGERPQGGSSSGGGEQKTQQKQQQQQKKQEYKPPATDKDVVVLTEANFDSTVFSSKDIWLIEFYAPWCGHCKALEPEWNEAAAQLKGTAVRLAKVDADTEKSLGSRFGVQGFPTIKYFNYGLPKSASDAKAFEGGRNAKAITDFANELLDKADIAPEIYEITSQKKFDKYCTGTTICAISFLPNIYESSAKQRNEYLNVHKAVAKANRKQRLVNFWSEAGSQLDLERKLNLGFGFPAVIVISPTKQVFGTMRGQYSEKGVGEYLRSAASGTVRNLEALPKGWEFKKASKWDGKDAKPIVEEPLEDL